MSQRIDFWPHVRDIATASYRLRCHQIVEGLQRQGIECSLYSKSARAPDTLVLSKRYDKATMEHAILMRSIHGTKIVLDICDNHFYYKNNQPAAIARANLLRDAVRTVDFVISSSEELATIIKREAGQEVIVKIVEDAVEYPFTPAWQQRIAKPFPELYFYRLQRWLATQRAQATRNIVWFGNHGSGFADGGMADLLQIKEVLQSAARECPITLTVISNSKKKFQSLIADWHIPVFYLDWHQNTFSRALALHDVSVIPISQNPFTVCKTSNRVATSLLHGLAVVADAIPSYLTFSDCISLNDWKAAFEEICSDSAKYKARVPAGVEKIRSEFSREAIVQQWISALVTLQPACLPAFHSLTRPTKSLDYNRH